MYVYVYVYTHTHISFTYFLCRKDASEMPQYPQTDSFLLPGNIRTEKTICGQLVVYATNRMLFVVKTTDHTVIIAEISLTKASKNAIISSEVKNISA